MQNGVPVDLNDLSRFAATYFVRTVMIRSDDPEYADPPEKGELNETECRLAQYLKTVGDKGAYNYNADDGWEITIRLGKRHLPEKGIVYPRCIRVSRGFVDYQNEQGEWTPDIPDDVSSDFMDTNLKSWAERITQQFRALEKDS